MSCAVPPVEGAAVRAIPPCVESALDFARALSMMNGPADAGQCFNPSPWRASAPGHRPRASGPEFVGDEGRGVLDGMGREDGAIRSSSAASASAALRAFVASPISTTISPLGGPSAANCAASSGRVPRRTVSNILVSSRATTACRSPRTAAASASISGRRCGASNSMSVPGNHRQLGEARPARGALRRQEALEEEAVGRQAGDDERRRDRRRAGDGRHRQPRLRSPPGRACSRDPRPAACRHPTPAPAPGPPARGGSCARARPRWNARDRRRAAS